MRQHAEAGGRRSRVQGMADTRDELNISELDDGYLKILLLLAVRRASSSEPRRAGFWHGLAGILSTELEMRQATAQVGTPTQRSSEAGKPAEEMIEFGAVLDELRRDVATLESEYRDSYGDVSTAADRPSS